VYFIEEVAHFLVCHELHSRLGHPGGTNDEHTHGVHVHHEVPPNRCDEPAAVYLFAEENRSNDCGHSHSRSNHCHHHNDNSGEHQVKLFPVSPTPDPKPVCSADNGVNVHFFPCTFHCIYSWILLYSSNTIAVAVAVFGLCFRRKTKRRWLQSCVLWWVWWLCLLMLGLRGSL